MLDQPHKTQKLLVALEAALPFEVTLTDRLIQELRRDRAFASVKVCQLVSNVSYAGDEGGIMCHIKPEDGQPGIHVSITHLRVPPSLAFATALTDYQKHRIKKLKKSTKVDL